MASIALVSGRTSAATANVNTDAALVDKGHTVTFFDQSAVTAVNLAAFALIYCNVCDAADTTFEGHIRGYMRTDNIPVIIAGYDGTGLVTDHLISALGIAQDMNGVTTNTVGKEDAVLITGYEDIQSVSGLDAEFPTRLRTADDEGWFIPRLSKHKGTKCLEDANGDVIMFQALATETDFTDTSQTLGARFGFVGWSGDDGHGRDGAALIAALIEFCLSTTFLFPTTGNQLAILRGKDLDRLTLYNDSAVNWTATTPAGTSITVTDSQDELATFGATITNGGEINGFTLNDPISGHVFIRVVLDTTNSANTPTFEQADMTLEGQAPSLRQLGAGVDANPAVLAEDGWYTNGLVSFTSGQNKGINMEVRGWTNATRIILLFEVMPFPIAVGDTFDVYVGCDKTRDACVKKFDNIVNFRGFPFVPGNDQLYRAPPAPNG